jgi:hypothetical protein
MTTHNGKRITQRGGADAGRGDDAHGVTNPAMLSGEDMEYFKNRVPQKTSTKENTSCDSCGAGEGEGCSPHCLNQKD